MTQPHPYTIDFPNSWWLRHVSDTRDNRDRRLQCRKTFTLEAVPETAVINVTADAKYSLWVNGTFVNFGPARGFQDQWPFDRIDIAPFLKPGKNVIAALAYDFAISNYTYSYEWDFGFLLAGVIDGIDLATNETWKCRIAKGYLSAVARAAGQYAFQEFFDCRLGDDNWFMPDYDDSQWGSDAIGHLRVAGCMPWHDFSERAIPLLTHDILYPKKHVAITRTSAPEDAWKQNQNIAFSYNNEAILWERQPDGDPRKLAFSQGVTGHIIDFGEQVVGQPIFSIFNAEDGDTLDYMVLETCTDGQPHTPPSHQGLPTCYGGRLILKKGDYTHQLTLPWGFRYIMMWHHGKAQNMKVAASVRQIIYPLEETGTFASTNSKWNAIWKICEHAQRCCTVDGYIDCPWRENAQWWGDALVQSQNTFRLANDPRILERGLRLIAKQRVPNGLTYGMAPTCGHVCILPDYSAMWIITLLADYRQTGKPDLYLELKDRVDEVLDYFRKEAAITECNLLQFDRRYWLFLDWCPNLFKEGTPTVLNLIWLLALEAARTLAEVTGDRGKVTALTAEIQRLKDAIEHYLYNPETKLLYDGLTYDGLPVETHSPHAAALGILTDLLPEAHQTWLDAVLLPLVSQDKPTGTLQPSVYFMYYIFEALKKYNYKTETIDCIQRWWGEFVDTDCSTTPEYFLEAGTPGSSSWCHAWSAHPIVHYSEILLGVRQMTPGWTHVAFEPLLIEGEAVSGTVPTPFGPISVAWNCKDGKHEKSIKVPEGITVVK